MPATEQGKAHALEMLEQRRQASKDSTRKDNSDFPAGAPMYYYCLTCGTEMEEPELWITRDKLCRECNALKIAGWLE